MPDVDGSTRSSPESPIVPPEDEGMNLTSVECSTLALRLIARFVQSDQEWIEWESLPNLSENAWLRLVDAITNLGNNLMEQSRKRDEYLDIDTADLIERATRWPPPPSRVEEGPR